MRRIILSRKGFDSSTGKKPSRASPIFEDGRIFSVPVHINTSDPDTYKDVEYGGINAFEAIKYAYKNARDGVPYHENDSCHFDPNLSVQPGLFGQQGNDQTELEKGGVREGDLFIFFGWFQTYSKEKESIDSHHIFGWLQIEEIIHGTGQIKTYCDDMHIHHPHASGAWKKNTLYVSSSDLNSSFGTLNGKGSGFFKTTDPKLILSEKMCSSRKSRWQLPKEYFPPSQQIFAVSNAKGPKKWMDPKNLIIDANGQWQELILNSEKFPSIEKWAFDLIKDLS